MKLTYSVESKNLVLFLNGERVKEVDFSENLKADDNSFIYATMLFDSIHKEAEWYIQDCLNNIEHIASVFDKTRLRYDSEIPTYRSKEEEKQ